jgi:hypothetical protein
MEIRVGAGYNSMTDVRAMYEQMLAAFNSVPNTNVVIAADWRGCQQIAPSAMHGVGSILKDFNNHIERSAVLAAPTASVSVTQFLDVIRKGGHPARRLYLDPKEMMTWLDQLLTPAEQERLRRFVAGA